MEDMDQLRAVSKDSTCGNEIFTKEIVDGIYFRKQIEECNNGVQSCDISFRSARF